MLAFFAGRAERARASKHRDNSHLTLTPSTKIAICFRLADRFGWKCWYCNKKLIPPARHQFGGGIRGSYPHIDHVKPQCDGGDDGIDNLALSCAFCNMAKGAADVHEFLAWLDAIRTGDTRTPIRAVLNGY
jgi:hypothetical protein